MKRGRSRRRLAGFAASGEQRRAGSRDRSTPTVPLTLRDQAFDPGEARNPAVLHDDWPKAHWEIACADLAVLRDAADWPVPGLTLCLVRVPRWQPLKSAVRSRMAACLELAAAGR